jgi:1D-myo-inositol 3-kinase
MIFSNFGTSVHCNSLHSPMLVVFFLQAASKVGPDFLYCSQITHPPQTLDDQPTTEFFADFTQGEERVLKAGNICEPIEPENIPDMKFELGLAVGIACEVLPETLQRMVEVSRYVVVDVQVCSPAVQIRP